ncbi:MAG: DUF3055 domain-containing protein [Thermoflavifilum sp.]|nr:DUF3055 domain-containing protein [Thermoflavifilum sp.]MCL6513238.1 DUF3055 domain-containing protein [Alicyclobacillus sp.]
MQDWWVLYDETENTRTRFIGCAGEHARYDVAITETSHFYGKRLVCVIQNGRTAILSDEDAANVPYLMEAFGIQDEAEADEFSRFLLAHL